MRHAPEIRVRPALAARDALAKTGYYNGKQVDQGVASKAQQDPEGEMEGTETEAATEAHPTLA